MIRITKRDGHEEPFILEKIVVNVLKSGAPPDVSRFIAQKIEKTASDGMSTREIRGKVLSMLTSINSEWKRRWLFYEMAKKKTEPYHRGFNPAPWFQVHNPDNIPGYVSDLRINGYHNHSPT